MTGVVEGTAPICESHLQGALRIALSNWAEILSNQVTLSSCVQLVGPASSMPPISSTQAITTPGTPTTTRVTPSVSTTTESMTTETNTHAPTESSTLWPQPVSESCPALVETEELTDILAHTEDEANRYCVRVCGVGSWCKCDADKGQPKVCQHGLLQQCGYRLCDCGHLCGRNNTTRKRGTAAAVSAPVLMRVRYSGQVGFDVDDTVEVARLVELIRFNTSGLDAELMLATDGGEVEPSVVPVMELLQSSNPIIRNPDIVMNIVATIYLIILPMWQPSVMESSLIMAVKTFFRTQIGEADVSISQAVEIEVLINNTTPRLMLETLVDQEAFLMAAGIALGPGISVGNAMPSLIEYPEEMGGYLPLPKNPQSEKTTLTILLVCAVSASLIGLIIACCIVIRIIIQYRRSGASRDFELGKAGEVASSRADEETALDATSVAATRSFFTERSDTGVSSRGSSELSDSSNDTYI